MCLISKAHSIALETRRGTSIKNELVKDQPHPGAQIAFDDNKKRFPRSISRTSSPINIYNCHGLTFASRRTNVCDPNCLENIIREDGYKRIAKEAVLPGDIILYRSSAISGGEIEHSGVVIDVKRHDIIIPIPIVLSKWGELQEAIHDFNECPYDSTHVEYYRVVE